MHNRWFSLVDRSGNKRRCDRHLLPSIGNVLQQRFMYSGQCLVRRVFLVLTHVSMPVTTLGARVPVHFGYRVRGKSQTPSCPRYLVLGSRRVLGHHRSSAIRPYPQHPRIQTTRPVFITLKNTRSIINYYYNEIFIMKSISHDQNNV